MNSDRDSVKTMRHAGLRQMIPLGGSIGAEGRNTTGKFRKAFGRIWTLSCQHRTLQGFIFKILISQKAKIK